MIFSDMSRQANHTYGLTFTLASEAPTTRMIEGEFDPIKRAEHEYEVDHKLTDAEWAEDALLGRAMDIAADLGTEVLVFAGFKKPDPE